LTDLIKINYELELGRVSINEAIIHYYEIDDLNIPAVDGLFKLRTTEEKNSLYVRLNGLWILLLETGVYGGIPYDKMWYNPTVNGDPNYPPDSVIMCGKYVSQSTDITNPQHLNFNFMNVDNLYVTDLNILHHINQVETNIVNLEDQYIILNNGLTRR
jgi:hypothetical protein